MFKILINKKNLNKYNDYILSILSNFSDFNIIIIDDLYNNETKINDDIGNKKNDDIGNKINDDIINKTNDDN